MKKTTCLILFGIVLFSCKESPPEANFEMSLKKSYIGQKVLFINKTIDAKSYTWDFGDGQTSTEINPEHIFTNGGLKTIVLIARNDGGDNIFMDKLQVYDGKSSYQVKNATSYSLKLVSYFWTGTEIIDYQDHQNILSNELSDTIYTSRNIIRLGGQISSLTFVVTTDYPIKENTHNIVEINDKSPIYSKSGIIPESDIQLKKIKELNNFQN